jgi:hypothetical protein
LECRPEWNLIFEILPYRSDCPGATKDTDDPTMTVEQYGESGDVIAQVWVSVIGKTLKIWVIAVGGVALPGI